MIDAEVQNSKRHIGSSFRQALELNPHYLKARINLGFTLMEQGRYEEAEQELKTALETDPNHPLIKSAIREIAEMKSHA